MRVEVDPRAAAGEASELASFGHTAALVCVILAVAITGTLLQHSGLPEASLGARGNPAVPGVWPQYLTLLLVNGLLALYVARLFRPKNALPQLVGRRWRSFADAASDLLYACFAFALIVAIESLTSPLHAGRNAAISALLPRTEAERLTWLLVAACVGFCEEVVYRGYLQAQLGALTRSPALGLVLQALLFGLAHLEQGTGVALRIGAYGLVLGLLARRRQSLLPGIVCHIGIDLLGGLVR